MVVRGSPVSHEAITVSNTSIGLTTIPVFATGALIDVEGQDVRYLLTKTAVTATTGHSALAGDVIELHMPAELEGFTVIRSSGVDATLRVTYMKGA